jgi:hypothetical protein
MHAGVSNGCGTVTSNASYVGITLPPARNLVATRTAAQKISLAWTAAAGAHRYRVERKSGGQGFATVGQSTGTSLDDTTVALGRTYVYRVVALDANGGSASEPSNHDLATTMTFTSITAGLVMDDGHWTELLTALGSLYGAQGLSAPTWNAILPAGIAPPGPNVTVSSAHLAALRGRMDAALKALGVASGPYLDDPVRAGETIIKAAHVTALQQRAQ